VQSHRLPHDQAAARLLEDGAVEGDRRVDDRALPRSGGARLQGVRRRPPQRELRVRLGEEEDGRREDTAGERAVEAAAHGEHDAFEAAAVAGGGTG